jgi:hypothetical protein
MDENPYKAPREEASNHSSNRSHAGILLCFALALAIFVVLAWIISRIEG